MLLPASQKRNFDLILNLKVNCKKLMNDKKREYPKTQ